jgi:hypothetical protein
MNYLTATHLTTATPSDFAQYFLNIFGPQIPIPTLQVYNDLQRIWGTDYKAQIDQRIPELTALGHGLPSFLYQAKKRKKTRRL